MSKTERLVIADEVAAALAAGTAVVALESTILAHGLPWDRNLQVGRELERIVRDAGAVPATIAVLDGAVRVGLDDEALRRVCAPDAGLRKLSRRDIGTALALGTDGATTVAATASLAAEAGIPVFATGGLGGVHLAAPEGVVSWDVSADLGVLAHTPVLVVCSGVKSVLDIGATLEVLETASVPVLGYGTDMFPAFYLRESPFEVPWRVDTPSEAAAVARSHWTCTPGRSGLLLANPIAPEHEMDRTLHDHLLAGGMDLVRSRGVRGKDVTPVLLEHFHSASGGVSLDANEALVRGNAELAAQVAVELTKL
jgi:pseudouridylate synthase